MTEQFPTAPAETAAPFPVEVTPYKAGGRVEKREGATSREQEVMTLLGTDYEALRDNGDLDIFYSDRATSRDALLHILTGDSFNRQPNGYHSHAASTILQLSEIEKPTFREEPEIPPKDSMTPYRAEATINGLEKKDKAKFQGLSSPFFPDGFDPTSIVRYISYAYKHRDVSEDEIITNPRGEHTRTIGRCLVPCGADGSDMMKIEMILNSSGKIISAYPTSIEELSS